MNNKYNVKHVRRNINDFLADCDRFRFTYKEPWQMAYCYGGVTIIFDGDITADVQAEISQIIWAKIDKDEHKWSYPKKAYEIADRYCAEEFS